MIKEIILKNVATYKEEEIEPKKINYFYGSNGSGKTTISNLLQNPEQFENCKINWDNDKELETLVYNKQFLNDNFENLNSIKGIFTLGKDTKDAKEFIDNAKKLQEANNKELEILRKSLEKVKQDLENEDSELEKICWDKKQKYESDFKNALSGSISSKKSFMKKCLEEKDNDSELLTSEELKEKYNNVFSDNKQKYNKFEKINFDKIVKLENNDILQKNIIGTQESEVGKLIKK